MTDMADSAAFSGPRDAAVMEAILKEMGIEDFEPNVIHQMLEFSYGKYSSLWTTDSLLFSCGFCLQLFHKCSFFACTPVLLVSLLCCCCFLIVNEM